MNTHKSKSASPCFAIILSLAFLIPVFNAKAHDPFCYAFVTVAGTEIGCANQQITFSGCGSMPASAQAGLRDCTDNNIPGKVSGTDDGGGLLCQATTDTNSVPGAGSWKITLKDPTKPGKVTITATVSGRVHSDCNEVTYTASCVIIYTPPDSSSPSQNSSSCQTCNSQSGSPSASSADVDASSLKYRLNLGQSTQLGDAGFLWLYSETPSTNLAQPSALKIPVDSLDVSVVTNSDGSIAQVFAPQMLVNVNVITNYEYQLQCFYASNVTAMTGGRYGTNGPAFDIWTIQNPDGNVISNRIWITEQPIGSASRQYEFTYVAANLEWDLLEPDGETTVSAWMAPCSTNDTITNYFRQTSAGGNIASSDCKTFQYVAAFNQKLLPRRA